MSSQGQKTLVEQLEHDLGFVAGTALAEEMRLYITRLGETNDLNWIDLMVWRLTEEDVPLPTVIQNLAGLAAKLRLNGHGRRNGKVTRVMREHSKAVANAQIAFLRGALGGSTEESAGQAANATSAELGYAGMASTRAKEFKTYLEDGPVGEQMTTIGRAWAEIYPEQKDALANYLAEVPQRDPGKRR